MEKYLHGKNLHHKYSNMPLVRCHPGSMWSMLNLFDFHQRLHKKKALPQKKDVTERQAGGSKSPGAASEGHNFTDGKVDSGLIEDQKTETSATCENSGKMSIKALIAEEMSKEPNQKHRNRASPARLSRSHSMHHLEHPDYDPDERTAVHDNLTMTHHPLETSTCCSRTHDPVLPKYPEEQIISDKQCEICSFGNKSTNYLDPDKLEKKLNQAKEAFLKLKQINDKGVKRDVSLHPSKEFIDALDVLNKNGELFLKILQDPNSILTMQGKSNPEAVVSKSGSVPATEFPGKRAASLLKLRQKQKEIESYPKQKRKAKSKETISSPRVVNFSEDSFSDSVPSRTIEVTEIRPSLECLPDSSHELISHKENRLVRNRFKDIKQRIKHAIKESKKERLWISMDGILHRIPYGRKACKNAKSVIDRYSKQRNGYNSDSAASVSAQDAPIQFRRTTSLTESLDKYSRLFESVSRRDSNKNLSERSKLANEDENVKDWYSSKTFQRIFSMPDNIGRDADGEVPGDMLYKRTPSRIHVDGNANAGSCASDNQNPGDNLIYMDKCRELNSFVESENQENYVKNITGSINEDEGRSTLDSDDDGNAERGTVGDDLKDSTVMDGDVLPYGQEVWLEKNASDKSSPPRPISVLKSCAPQDVMSSANFSVSKVSPEVEARHMDFNETIHTTNLCDQSGITVPDNLKTMGSISNIEIENRLVDSSSGHVQVDRKDEANFNYVSHVLKKSGFSGDELLGTWHSPDHPVDPLLFNEGEVPHMLDILGGKDASICDHQLLFDLINEVLLEIYQRSITYSPWNVCSNSNIRPMPMGYHVLEEVWASVRWHLSSQPELCPSLEYVVSRDLAKNDGWMHLQLETEFVALELEDWIADDLLDGVTIDIANS